MGRFIMVPLRILGWAAAGFAVAAAWKLGCYLVDEVMRETSEKGGTAAGEGCGTASEGEPLWRRKYSKISVD
jgi:hypothetical protein